MNGLELFQLRKKYEEEGKKLDAQKRREERRRLKNERRMAEERTRGRALGTAPSMGAMLRGFERGETGSFVRRKSEPAPPTEGWISSNTTTFISEGQSDSTTCPICVDSFSKDCEVRMLPCLHAFHSSCIDPWLLKNPHCPTCRKNPSELNRQGKHLLDTHSLRRFSSRGIAATRKK
eukprot:TRINITY_DN3398_c0_g1_i2.p1 TRINITY_DN3398_c0_g1~~TRINITY_DN3398_c0_g1_i2.p1  ORF type:complete len:177 (+),score=20.20 TRINITY_DN3398_c0_g1_i2:28-558(+)